MSAANGTFRFSVFTLNVAERTLYRGGQKTVLQEQAFRVLHCLVRRPGEVVSRLSISEELWGRNVQFDADQAINKAINQIRWCLGDSPKAARYIETVPREGYRFVAPVNFVSNTPAEQETNTAASPVVPTSPQTEQPQEDTGIATRGIPHKPQKPTRLKYLLRVGLVAALLCIAVAAVLLRKQRKAPPVQTAAASGQRISLLVVPIQAPAALQQKAEWLRYDLADALGHVPGVRVPATHLFKGTQSDPAGLREALSNSHADVLMMGELQPSGDGCTLMAELVRAADMEHLAGIRIESASCSLPEIRERASYAVQHSLLGTQEKQSDTDTGAAQAYEFYLQGKHELYARTDESLDRANRYFEKAVALDPKFADAYAGMANVYLLLADRDGLKDGYGMAMRLARRAIQINPSSALGHGVLGCALLSSTRDWTGALHELELANELAPDEAVYHVWLGSLYSGALQPQKAIEQYQAARSADPFWFPVYQVGALAYRSSGDYPSMLAAAKRLVNLAPYWPSAYITEANAFWTARRYRDAVTALERAAELSRDPVVQAREKAARAAFLQGGPKAYAQAQIEPYLKQKDFSGTELEAAEWAAYAEQKDVCLKILTAIAAQRNSQSLMIASDPAFHPFQADPAFKAIVDSTRAAILPK